MATMTYLQAISDAMREEMRADERVFLMGEDIGTFGGAFKVTDGFIDEFGPKRVMDTPLAESAIVGCAIGAAVEGLRPIAEMQFSDFVSCGFDQLVNVAGKTYYRMGLSVNITVRLPSGGGFSGGPYHSQNPEAWFMHAPGLKIVAPSTAEDAKGLLIAAVRESVKAEIDAAVEEALKSPMPDPNTVTDGLFADEPALLEDGNAPWSGFKGGA